MDSRLFKGLLDISFFLLYFDVKPPQFHLLLVDDDEDDCLLFEDALWEVNNNVLVTIAKDGEQFIRVFNRESVPGVDIIFLDLNMPCKNGFEYLLEIRQDDRLKHVPVIILSTSSEAFAVERAYQLGANFYIRKPGTFSQLKRLIRKILTIDWKDNLSQPTKDRFVIST